MLINHLWHAAIDKNRLLFWFFFFLIFQTHHSTMVDLEFTFYRNHSRVNKIDR